MTFTMRKGCSGKSSRNRKREPTDSTELAELAEPEVSRIKFTTRNTSTRNMPRTGRRPDQTNTQTSNSGQTTPSIPPLPADIEKFNEEEIVYDDVAKTWKLALVK